MSVNRKITIIAVIIMVLGAGCSSFGTIDNETTTSTHDSKTTSEIAADNTATTTNSEGTATVADSTTVSSNIDTSESGHSSDSSKSDSTTTAEKAGKDTSTDKSSSVTTQEPIEDSTDDGDAATTDESATSSNSSTDDTSSDDSNSDSSSGDSASTDGTTTTGTRTTTTQDPTQTSTLTAATTSESPQTTSDETTTTTSVKGEDRYRKKFLAEIESSGITVVHYSHHTGNPSVIYATQYLGDANAQHEEMDMIIEAFAAGVEDGWQTNTLHATIQEGYNEPLAYYHIERTWVEQYNQGEISYDELKKNVDETVEWLYNEPSKSTTESKLIHYHARR